MIPETTFNQRQQQFQQAEQVAQRRHNQLAFWRLIWFIGSIVAVWLLIEIDRQIAAIAVVVIGITGFLVFLKKHQAVKQDRDLAHYSVFVNEDEAARLRRKYLRSETGESFINQKHFYSGDLDVFGKHSLFRLLNRTHTREGQNRLATWLQNPSAPDAIRLRQQAVSELKPQLDWRQKMAALALAEETIGNRVDKLVTWANSPDLPLPAYLTIIRFLLPAITLVIFFAWLVGFVSGLAVLVMLGIHGFVLSQAAARTKEVSEQTFEISAALKAFRTLFQQAEQVGGETVRLRAIRKALTTSKQLASNAIGHLARQTEGLNYRRNPYFYLLFGVATLWDIHYLFRLADWKKQHGPDLSRWFEALGELEALNSLAGFAYAHPNYAIPDITDNEMTLAFSSASHPLLPPDRSVANSLTLAGSGQTILITGSNMSGKSTFLRTVGANVVLALAGAVVTATKFSCSPVQVFTSMRTHDSLEESTSSFYAELKRLQTLIELSKRVSTIPVLYFLDEILKGTNSADRHRGAEALIRQLHRTTAAGFVSTHDLELGQLADANSDNSADFVSNFHFQSDLNEGELVFDYKLRDGICQSFNASQLMRAIGIEISAAASETI